MTLINCNREQYLKALETRIPSRAEAEILHAAASGLFKNLEYGRRIAFCTWLMVARADVRKKRALSRVTLEEQRAIVERLREQCPRFFEGMLVLDDVTSPTEAATGA